MGNRKGAKKGESHKPGNHEKGKKKSWIDLHCQGIVDNISKKAYQLLKVLTRRKQGQSNTIRDKNGNCLAEAQDILTR